MNQIFENKVAIITGGASGIGKSICQYLAGKGSKVIIADINYVMAREVAVSITSAGGNAKAMSVDVTNAGEVESLINNTSLEYGRIDFLFNNAGMAINGEFQDMSPDHWRQIMQVNLWSVVYGCMYAYPVMMRQGYGQIINTASLAGLIPGGLSTGYTATKHAVVGFTLSLRAEARQYGIKVNALCPGYIRTNIQKEGIVVTGYLRAEKNVGMEADMKFKTPDDCIERIMRGVRKNRGVIVSPGKHRIYWWMHRISPELIPNMFHRVIKKMKKNAGIIQET
jgi:NAD(P)-dependent dehydrogenase (short-subunit alcohol dehydrogenase family)